MLITRFAPSPTGYLHIGNLRTALFNCLITRREGGRFILRIDDTDQERSKPEFIDALRRDLEWLGINWDQEERQSARLELYHEAAQKLRDADRLYECFESASELDLKRKKLLNMGKPPVYDRAALALSDKEREELRANRPSYWRFRLDHERINWSDGILGSQSIDAASLSDPVLIRADGQILYTLASVVDDIGMKISHVVRGADHVTNTATQIQLIAALGGATPDFSHHSMLTGPQGEPLSKRLGSLALRDFREAGAEPMALLSLMSTLGSGQPLQLARSVDELAQNFSLSDFGAAPSKFDPDEIGRISANWLRAASGDEVADELFMIDENLREKFWDMARENINKRVDIGDLWKLVSGPITPLIDEEDKAFVEAALAILPERPWSASTWQEWTGEVKKETGRSGRALFLPLRKALMGRETGPDMGKFMALRSHFHEDVA